MCGGVQLGLLALYVCSYKSILGQRVEAYSLAYYRYMSGRFGCVAEQKTVKLVKRKHESTVLFINLLLIPLHLLQPNITTEECLYILYILKPLDELI